ncbi:MAG: hypothetical protein Q4B48_02740 [Syntrophomonadaceae bacterium]|nr:hypothetical protein [Syntrophomonadaceae bacterium]
MQNHIYKLLRSAGGAKEPQCAAAQQAAERVRAAACELRQAYELFGQMDAPAMIEHATYVIKAAEVRYEYLLKEYREEYGETPASAAWFVTGGEE